MKPNVRTNIRAHPGAFVVLFIGCLVGGFLLIAMPLLGALIIVFSIIVYLRIRLHTMKKYSTRIFPIIDDRNS